MNPLPLLFMLAFLVFLDSRILTPLLPSISLSLGSSPGTVGLAMTTYALAYGIGQLFYGPLSDRLGRVAVVRVTAVGFSICVMLSSLSVTTGQFIVTRLFAGALAGAIVPLTLVFIGDTVEYDRRQSVMGRLAVFTSSAMAFSASIGGTIAHFISWRMMLLGYGALALIPVGLLWRVAAQTPGDPPPGSVERFRDFLSNGYALFIYGAVLLQGILLWGAVTYLGAFATQRYGIDQLTVGLLIALFGIGMVTGGLLMGWIRSRFSENELAAGAAVMIGAPLLALIPHWPVAVFSVGMVVLGLGHVCLHTTLQVRGTEISPTARGKAFSLFAFFLFSGMSIGSTAFGWLVDRGYYEAMFAIAGTGMAGVGFATALAPRGRRSSPADDRDRRHCSSTMRGTVSFR